MTNYSRLPLLLLLVASWPAAAAAQGTAADYERAARLRGNSQNKVFRTTVRPQWLSGGSRFWYRVETGPGKHEFILVDAAKGERKAAFDHVRLAASLSKVLGRQVAHDRLPLERLEFDETGERLSLTAGGRRWQCDLASYELKEAPASQNVTSGGASVRWLEGPRPSARTGAEITLTFVNRLQEAVELFWNDPDGQRRSYGRIEPGARHEQHTYEGHVWLLIGAGGSLHGVVEATGDATEVVIGDSRRAVPSRPRSGRFQPRRRGQPQSPDGKWTVLVKEYNLVLKAREGEEEFMLTSDGSAEESYSADVHWSPASTHFVALKTKSVKQREIHLIESSPRDQLQPKLHTLSYPKPGDPLPVRKPRLFEVASRREIPISDELFRDPWSIEDIRWDADSSRFTFRYNQRGHQVLRLVAVSAADGQVRAIIDEQSPTFIDYAHKQFIRHLERTGEILWMSERDGWNHLYLYDARTGQVKNQVTSGPWVVRGVERVDEENRRLVLRVAGINPAQDPYFIHYVRINFDGSGLVRLTEGNGTHRIEFSPDGKYVLDTYSRVDLPPVTELRSAEDGRLVCELERGDWQLLLESSWQVPIPFAAKGRDGHTDIYGVIWRLTNFDPTRKYPVIEHIYAGPQGAFVPKEFRPHYRQQELAELGFIVVQIDGMGTNWRSKAFHDVCWKNLADAGFPDRIAWMKAAAASRPWMDISRVGVYGGSAGGQNALGAVLFHGDFYDAAAADCGCHDNRMDKMWWNEAWMGYPIGPHYEEQSNVTNAHKLRGKLLLTVGELDRNVDPASTMQVVNALVRANKDFELLIVPGAGHGVGESPYAARRRADFFVRHLLGVEPPDRNR
jgi:dipeptidyl aminopeptidase/acylaminoacyl peptidase